MAEWKGPAGIALAGIAAALVLPLTVQVVLHAREKRVDPAEIPVLIRQLDSPATSLAAEEALSHAINDSTLHLFHEAAAGEPSVNALISLSRLIAFHAAPSSQSVLVKLLGEERSGLTRRNAAWGLGRLALPSCEQPLVRALTDDTDDRVRAQAARALWMMKGADAEPILSRACRTEKLEKVRLILDFYRDPAYKGTIAPPIVPGRATRGSFEGTPFKIYVPSTYRPGTTHDLFVCLHGTDGVPDPWTDTLAPPDAEKHRLIVLAPFFDRAAYRYYDGFNLLLGETRSDLRLLEIVEFLATKVSVRKDKFYLLGQSRGGQFVSRFVLAYPERIIRAAATGSGNYVLPNPDAAFPDGTRANPYAPDLSLDFAKLVRTDMAVIVGGKDSEANVRLFREFQAAVQGYAQAHAAPCRVEFIFRPEGHHGGHYPTASKFLFRDRP